MTQPNYLPLILALAVIAALLAGAAIWFVWRWRRTTLNLPQFVLLLLNYSFNRLLWCTTVNRPLPVPPGTGAVIVANHRSSIDPLLIQIGTERVVHWMVAREYVEHWALRGLFRILRSIPVGRRGIDTAATKMAIRFAQQGGLVGLFPEGRINHGQEVLLSGRPGAALIALKANVPVVPCYIEGAPYRGTEFGPFFMPARVQVRFGDPIDVTPYQRDGGERQHLKDLTRKMMSEIAALGGVAEYEPALAGKVWLDSENGNNAAAES